MNRSLDDTEKNACTPSPVDAEGFNPGVSLPYGCTTEHVRLAMNDFTEFLGFINEQLHTKSIARLESILMPANFSSIVGEFICASIPRHCPDLVKNRYHNGHPDLLPAGRFENDAVQHSNVGIEVKASRYKRGWQGHNPEDIWLMTFVFESSRPIDAVKGTEPIPFRFLFIAGASLTREDWTFSGRSTTSRRTITASVNESGYAKMMSNWIYKAAHLRD